MRSRITTKGHVEIPRNRSIFRDVVHHVHISQNLNLSRFYAVLLSLGLHHFYGDRRMKRSSVLSPSKASPSASPSLRFGLRRSLRPHLAEIYRLVFNRTFSSSHRWSAYISIPPPPYERCEGRTGSVSLIWWRGENRVLSRGIGGSNFGSFPRLPRSRWSPKTLHCCRLQIIPDLDGYRPSTGRSTLGRHVRRINLQEPVVVMTHIATVFLELSLSRHSSTARCSRVSS